MTPPELREREEGRAELRALSKRLAPTLDELIVALCRDYGRREEMLRDRASLSRRQEESLIYYNERILSSAIEVVGRAEAEIFVREIGDRTGYAGTAAHCSEGYYKRSKARIKKRIAEKLFIEDAL